MTKVTIDKDASPAAALVKAASAEHIVEAAGLRIKLRKPDILAQVGLIRIMGAEDAKNDVLRSMYAPLLYVTEINGDEVSPPDSQVELDILLKRIDEPGLVAIMGAVQEHFGAPATNRDAIKNS